MHSMNALSIVNDKANRELIQCNSGTDSSRKRKRPINIPPDEVADSVPEEAKNAKPRCFANAFERQRDPFKATEVNVMELHELVYQWYSLKLGKVIPNQDTQISTGMWSIPPGDTSVKDKMVDVKSIMKLVEMVASKDEMKILQCLRPDAGKDSTYGVWETKEHNQSCRRLHTFERDQSWEC